MSANVTVRSDGRGAEVVLGSGGSANALGHEDWRALELAFRNLSNDVRVVVVRGSGSTFSAGSDLREWVHAAPDDVDRAFAAMEAACTAIEECPTPVIAQVNGVAAGAGCQLALACDLRVFADDARIGMSIARLGILVSPAFAARLALLAGHGLARELL
ncbi:enoyl-CoA hydratase/isomerase family protein, partial [Kutzneria sp. 744]|uniref:enoyl-CoA hydratase/isomerase family protein n=1 Tax=Kutzneria sp. (strain 744) TaxID=345341 RepID=UPI0003EEDC3B